ncbi:MAG: hypothetical protein IMY72_11900 [Bacteroidetes bacterium]|nr:hypothetical protein [Bacteroidota bacterium]
MKHFLIKHNDVCRRCKGEGSIMVKDEFTSEIKSIPCTLCGGSGLVSVTKDITITISPKPIKTIEK